LIYRPFRLICYLEVTFRQSVVLTIKFTYFEQFIFLKFNQLKTQKAMKSKMFLLSAAAILFAGASMYSQTAPRGQGDAVKGEKSRGADPEAPAKGRVNGDKAGSAAIRPAEKGGTTRGGWCKTDFINYTGWYLDCYVNGLYEGYVAPYGDGTLYANPGDTKVYVKAEFTDGTYRSWGPVTKNCDYQILEMKVFETYYEWRLY
jgi:hypothetical protein